MIIYIDMDGVISDFKLACKLQGLDEKQMNAPDKYLDFRLQAAKRKVQRGRACRFKTPRAVRLPSPNPDRPPASRRKKRPPTHVSILAVPISSQSKSETPEGLHWRHGATAKLTCGLLVI